MPALLNKGQLKIQQMVFMIAAVTIFFVIVTLFYFSYKINDLEKNAVELEREEALALATKIYSSPELNFEVVSRGIDADKAMVLKEFKEYKDFFGVNGIIIKKIYPGNESEECKIGNYPECDTIKIFTQKDSSPVFSYVSLCRKKSNGISSYNNCELAVVMLEVK